MKKMELIKDIYILFILLILLLPIALDAQSQHIVNWVDTNALPADSFTVYRAIHPDSTFISIITVADTFWVDDSIEDDVRYWYRVRARKDHVESGMSNSVSGRSIDLTDGVFNTERILTYYPEDEMVMLVIYPPSSDCELYNWKYMITDIINIRCDSAVLLPPGVFIR